MITRNTDEVVAWGVRTKGSTDPFASMDLKFGAAGTEVVGVDSNGQYQLWAGGKDSDPDQFITFYWEIGYILKNGATYFTNPVDENVADTSGVYSTLDLSGTVAEGAEHVFVSWRNLTTSTRRGHARPTGSTDPNTSMFLSDRARVTGIVPLTGAGLAEYMIDDVTGSPDLFVYACFK
jgi:hypothetical protein